MKTIALVLVILSLIWPCWAMEYFVLGEQEGDGEVLHPTKVKEGPDGNIYVYDRMSVFIKVFSSEGNTVKNVEIADPINYLTISEHFIFAWSTDEDDNPFVLCIKRKGTEAEDLTRVTPWHAIKTKSR